MTLRDLAQRVVTLERRVEELVARASHGPGRKKDWRNTVGMFSGDEMMKQIDELAREYREADRRRARRGAPKPRKARA